ILGIILLIIGVIIGVFLNARLNIDFGFDKILGNGISSGFQNSIKAPTNMLKESKNTITEGMNLFK
ncbi:MAG: hypothetical protein Q9M94_06655, partial [Candidatus Gracilibacteria bacterium]|nr:hypothetical protein [Candidatus Gracilibacteria bacterium]